MSHISVTNKPSITRTNMIDLLSSAVNRRNGSPLTSTADQTKATTVYFFEQSSSFTIFCTGLYVNKMYRISLQSLTGSN